MSQIVKDRLFFRLPKERLFVYNNHKLHESRDYHLGQSMLGYTKNKGPWHGKMATIRKYAGTVRRN